MPWGQFLTVVAQVLITFVLVAGITLTVVAAVVAVREKRKEDG